MRELLQKLGLPVSEWLDSTISRAWQVHVARRGGEHVSRSSLFYAAATTDVLVRAVLDACGLQMREFERALGFPSAPKFEETTDVPNFSVRENTLAALIDYQKRLPDRPLDATGLSAAILDRPSDRLISALHSARVNLGRARQRLADITEASRQLPWIRMDNIPYPVSPLLRRFLDQAAESARENRLRGVTSSSLILSALEFEGGQELTSTAFLRRYMARVAGESALSKIFEQWMHNASDDVSSETVVTMPVAAVHESAYAIARRSTARGEIAARHFIGAMIAQTLSPTPTGARAVLLNLGVNPANLAQEFLNYLERNAPSDRADKITAWREFLGIRDEGFMPRFQAEATDGVDLLDVTGDVDAFATLMASRRLAPPLSIGLFGDWGSGKSFFMKRVQAAVAERAARQQPDFYDRIVQIEFNAWHYVEANLWASLVEHIFRNLRLTTEPPGMTADQRRAHLLTKLDAEIAARNAAQLALKKAEDTRDRAAQELDAKKKAADVTAGTLPNMRAKDFWDMVQIDESARKELEAVLRQLGVPAAVATNDDVRKTLDDLRSVGSRAWLFIAWTVKQPRVLLLLTTLIVLAPLAVLPIVDFLKLWMPEISAGIVQITTVIGTVTAWIARRVKLAEPVFRRLDDARAQIDGAVQKAESEHRADVVLAEDEVKRAKDEVIAAKGALETSEAAVATARNALEQITAGWQLARFIDERSASDDYRKLLGVLATVRNDFEKLSGLLDRSIEERSPKANKAKERYGIDRIILYIDDLDRCHPSRVVEVLQAVHLLLAFRLFVVVVGVDARWVSESLRQKHRALWRGKEDDGKDEHDDGVPGYAVQPHDYLEKIFQVPFWLEPMQPTTTATYIRNLLIDDIASDERDPSAQQGRPPGGSGTGKGSGKSRPGESRERAIRTTPEPEDAPKLLQIQNKEVEYMESDVIAELVGRSPRTAKRFVNTYRFFRAGIPTRRLEAFLDDKDSVPEYQRVLLLLAIVVGAPGVSVEVFAELRAADPNMLLADFAALLQGKAPSNGHGREWERASAALESFNARCGHLVDLLPKVARYSFRAPFAETPVRPREDAADETAASK